MVGSSKGEVYGWVFVSAKARRGEETNGVFLEHVMGTIFFFLATKEGVVSVGLVLHFFAKWISSLASFKNI